jgi:hypothetical protein
VFILEHFSSELLDVVCEAFCNASPDKEVPDKTTVH